ncbi:MAG: D-sedoheptulose 7-phosphate isomerase [Candidatus Sericytochromatia bacterium]|nr:D-sedoheptulose 7-phosphate isomerase [Candidatus Tanganyikabacteria bacterium]
MSEAFVRTSLETARQLLDRTSREAAGSIVAAADRLVAAFAASNKVLLCGNGGSAADAQHLAAELVSRFRVERRALPAIALTTDSSILTAIANDYDYERVFARQVEALGQPGDILVGISTSGNSRNVVAAMRIARDRGMCRIALLGSGGGAAAALADLAIVVSSADTPRIQEAHIAIGHILCELVERRLCEQAAATVRSRGSSALPIKAS